ncbi:hypothetical protein MHBO_003672, partial [Bonamia ostreae]
MKEKVVLSALAAFEEEKLASEKSSYFVKKTEEKTFRMLNFFGDKENRLLKSDLLIKIAKEELAENEKNDLTDFIDIFDQMNKDSFLSPPSEFSKKAFDLLSAIKQRNPEFKPYCDKIQESLNIRILAIFAKIYTRIPIQSLEQYLSQKFECFEHLIYERLNFTVDLE